MKIIMLLLACMMLSGAGYCQRRDSSKVWSTEQKQLLSKSRLQKAIGWTILGTGLPIMLVSGYFLSTWDKDIWDEDAGMIVFIGSTVYTAAGVGFIVAGKRNKKRALSLSLVHNRVIVPERYAMGFKTQPAISLTIPLN